MPRDYRKPLKGGGSRIIARRGGGQFTRVCLDAKVCQDCGAINLPSFIDDHGFTMKKYPAKCHSCGAKL